MSTSNDRCDRLKQCAAVTVTLRITTFLVLVAGCSSALPSIEAEPVRCGNGIIEGQEACDDGNDDNSDACTDLCAVARCGDSFVQAGEDCDDGNISDRDGCTNQCAAAVCGDGIWRRDLLFETEPGYERCDDGNEDENDRCTSLCAPPRCGDGLQQTDEACDDGNTVQTDSCLNDCTMARCGDGVIQDGVEQCDGSEDCSEGCILMTCGNGVVEGTEVCDDGNDVLTDACAHCRPARCGDGLVRSDKALGEAGYEACDDGNERPGDDCSVECLIDDHGNQIGSASVLPLEENLENYVQLLPTDSIPSARIDDISDADFLSLTVTEAGVYRFDVNAEEPGDPTCRLLRADGVTVGFQSDRTDTDRGCSVDTYLAAADTIYLEIARQTGAPFDYTVSLQKPCGNGLVDAGEDCDPEAPGSNALRCRRDCRKRRMLTLAGTTGCAAVNGGLSAGGATPGSSWDGRSIHDEPAKR